MKRVSDTLEVSRSNLIHRLSQEETPMKPITKADDSRLLPLIKDILAQKPSYGYRRVTTLLCRHLKADGMQPVNHKRIYRIMKANDMLLAKHGTRPSKTHDGKIITLKSNLRWCTDTFGLRCWNGDLVQVAFVLDCHDREIITWIASTRGITGEMIRDLMTEGLEKRFAGQARVPRALQWLSDNWPCYVARDTVEFGRRLGFEVCTTAPYSPESNGMAEAFVKTFKRDYAHLSDLKSEDDILRQLPTWFEDYNENAPHKGLKMKSPREYRRTISAD